MDGYRNAGRQLARAVGAEATALLEAAIVWPAERLSLPPQTAAFALSALGQERSIGIVVAHAHHLGWARGENVAAAVLVDFGEAGIAAARKIPPPDPQRQGMGVRGARHRSATRALVAVEDELGVEGVLAGLALAVDKKIEWGATCRYLETALRKPDPRMLPAMLDLLADDDHVRSLALAGILALKGAATPDCLLESLAASKGSMRRAGLVKALGRLPVATDRARIEAAIPAMRDAVLGTLAEDDEAVQSAAAEALAAFLRFLPGQDSPETVAALLAWLEDREAWPVPVIGALVDTGDPRVGPALHVRYREDPFGRYDLARCFATLGYEEACPDVARALDERLAREPGSDGIPELEVLAALGMPGQKAVLETTAAPERSEMRMQAMALLLSQGREEMFSPLLEQFETLCRMGPRDLRPVPGGYDPSTKHAHRVGELANLLLKHNAEAAYAVVAHASLADPNPELAGWLASSVARAAWDRPELRSIAVSLPKPLEN